MTERNEALLKALDLQLTADQRAIVLDPRLRPAVVIAGAGSGKTTVMAARMALLATMKGIGPARILGLTFTRKAAAELEHRVAEYIARARRAGLIDMESGDATVSTYHSFAQNLVRDHGIWAGVDPDLRIETDFALLPLLHSVVARTRALAAAEPGLRPSDAVTAVRRLDSELAEHAVSTDRLRAQEHARLSALGDEAELSKEAQVVAVAARERLALATVVDEFRLAKAHSGVMDYADMMRLAHATAFGSDEVVRLVREQFAAVLLDEYQDTSVVQRDLLQRLFGAGHPVLAVGDPKQSIYGFRGAALGNIEAFPQHFRRADGAPADVHTLRANFRSGATIVAIANASAAAQSPAAEAGQPPMDVGRPIADAAEVRAFESHADETAFVVDVVADEIARGRAPEDVLVLARANSDVGHFATALEAAGIPATSSVDAGLFEVPVVRDVLAMLAAATDPGSNDELARLLIGPRWRIGVRDLALLGARARELAHVPQEREPSGWRAALRQATAGSDPVESPSLRDALDDPGEAPYSPAASARFRALSGELGELARHAGDPVVELIARSLWMSGLDVESRLSATAERDCAAVDALLEVASRYYDAEPGSGAQGFLRAVRLARQSDDQPGFTAPDLPGCVRVMTIHKAKGLEAGLVIVPGMYAGAFDKATLKGHWTTTAAALPEDLRGDVAMAGVLAPRTKGAVAAIKEPAKDRLAAEQNRLVYVALTRARERLIVSSHVWHPAAKQPREPSAHLGLVAGVDGVASEAPIEVVAGTANPLQAAPVTAAFPQWGSTHSEWLGDCAALVQSQSSRAEDPWQQSGAPADGCVADWDADLAALQRERQARGTATAVVEVPDLIGTSDLQRLIADPDAYALARRRPMPRRPSRAAALGTRFHDWVAQRWSQLSLLDDPEQTAGPALDAAGEAELERLQQLFERSEYADLAPFAVEFPFATVIAGQPTSGRIDAVYRTEDGWEVVDWKTNDATEADALQLAVYRVAWARVNSLDPSMVSAAFFYVRRGERVVPERLPGEEELSRMLAVAEGARQVN